MGSSTINYQDSNSKPISPFRHLSTLTMRTCTSRLPNNSYEIGEFYTKP